MSGGLIKIHSHNNQLSHQFPIKPRQQYYYRHQRILSMRFGSVRGLAFFIINPQILYYCYSALPPSKHECLLIGQADK